MQNVYAVVHSVYHSSTYATVHVFKNWNGDGKKRHVMTENFGESPILINRLAFGKVSCMYLVCGWTWKWK